MISYVGTAYSCMAFIASVTCICILWVTIYQTVFKANSVCCNYRFKQIFSYTYVASYIVKKDIEKFSYYDMILLLW